jgi:hypothetical protein
MRQFVLDCRRAHNFMGQNTWLWGKFMTPRAAGLKSISAEPGQRREKQSTHEGVGTQQQMKFDEVY